MLESKRDSKDIAREVIHRCNNFLASLVVQGEAAMVSQSPQAGRETVESILRECEKMEQYLREQRKQIES